MSEGYQNPQIGAFLSRLDMLDAGGRARLKRCSGQTLNEARQLGLFYSILPSGIPPYQEEIYFLVATLYPLANGGGSGDFGAALRRAQQRSNRKGLDRRVESLLEADEAQLPFRLRQAVRFINSNQVKVNWFQLLDDLLHWNTFNRPVQRRWARSYFKE
jgi:CRISPR system Cascade subunit CasB